MSQIWAYFSYNIKAAFSTPKSVILSILDIIVTIVLVYALIVFLKKNNAERLIKYLAILLVFGSIAGSRIVNMPVAGKVFGNMLLLLVLAVLICSLRTSNVFCGSLRARRARRLLIIPFMIARTKSFTPLSTK